MTLEHSDTKTSRTQTQSAVSRPKAASDDSLFYRSPGLDLAEKSSASPLREENRRRRATAVAADQFLEDSRYWTTHENEHRPRPRRTAVIPVIGDDDDDERQ